MSGGSKRRCLYLAIGMVEIYVLVSFTKYIINPHHSNIDVTHASLAEFNRISTTTINALHYNLVLHIDLQNRNRYFNVYYDSILVMAYYQNQRFTTKNFANVVYQEKNETTHLTLALKGQQDMDNTLGVVAIEELAHQECLNSDVEQKPEQCMYDDNGDERNKKVRSSSEYDILVRIFLQTTAIPSPGSLISRMNWIGNSLLTCNLKRVPVTTTSSSFTSAQCNTDFYRVFHPPGSG